MAPHRQRQGETLGMLWGLEPWLGPSPLGAAPSPGQPEGAVAALHPTPRR